jgi:putative nucleotidyltransferase with HDIG domain
MPESTQTLYGKLKMGELVSSFSLALSIGEGRNMDHALRTCYIAVRLAEVLGLSEEERYNIFLGALLHDLGSVQIASEETKKHPDMPAIPLFSLRLIDDIEELGINLTKEISKVLVKTLDIHVKMGKEIIEKLALPVKVGEMISQHRRVVEKDLETEPDPGDQVSQGAELVGLADVLEFKLSRGLGQQKPATRYMKGRRKTLETVFGKDGFERMLALLESEGFNKELSEADMMKRLKEICPPEPLPADEKTMIKVIDSFSSLIDSKSSYTANHSMKVAAYSAELARLLFPEVSEKIRIAALLHDLGKLSVPSTILDKPGRLTEWEFESIRLHPYYTQRILGKIKALEEVAMIAGAHHERMDGKGYFQGLSAEMIPDYSRVLAVADVFDALTSDRPYRKGLSKKEAVGMIEKEFNGHLDAEIVNLLGKEF